jgi:two-component system, chemotaxis family, protein-glutamate methylesterase/glutaminase
MVGDNLQVRSTEQPRRIKVLVVDDSAFMRYTISQHLNTHPNIEVIGTARDGQEALELIPRLNPDVVTMDVEMPRLDGISTLRVVMAEYPRPVVMLSSLTQAGAVETIQALTLGAVDFITKPVQKSNIQAVMEEAAVKILKAASARVFAVPRLASVPPPNGENKKQVTARRGGDPVVVIGSSTGGPRALFSVFSKIRNDLPAAIVVVQHMPVGFTRSLAERLNSASDIFVKEAQPGDQLSKGQALLAPGGFHMTFDRSGTVQLNQTPSVHGVRPAIDVTVNSIAQFYGKHTVSVVLTGMGSDGTHGAVLVHNSGGRVIAEDESSCVVYGMPRSVIEAGVADEIVPLERIPHAIERAVRELSEEKG